MGFDPVNDYAHFGLGLALMKQGDRTGARRHLKLAVAMRPDQTDYRGALEKAMAESAGEGATGGAVTAAACVCSTSTGSSGGATNRSRPPSRVPGACAHPPDCRSRSCRTSSSVPVGGVVDSAGWASTPNPTR
ncbi:MAG: tetratricopeptide repeat protein [Acidimicrobiia bacterium]